MASGRPGQDNSRLPTCFRPSEFCAVGRLIEEQMLSRASCSGRFDARLEDAPAPCHEAGEGLRSLVEKGLIRFRWRISDLQGNGEGKIATVG